MFPDGAACLNDLMSGRWARARERQLASVASVFPLCPFSSARRLAGFFSMKRTMRAEVGTPGAHAHGRKRPRTGECVVIRKAVFTDLTLFESVLIRGIMHRKRSLVDYGLADSLTSPSIWPDVL